MEKAKIKQTGVLGEGWGEVKRNILTILTAVVLLVASFTFSSCESCKNKPSGRNTQPQPPAQAQPSVQPPAQAQHPVQPSAPASAPVPAPSPSPAPASAPSSAPAPAPASSCKACSKGKGQNQDQNQAKDKDANDKSGDSGGKQDQNQAKDRDANDKSGDSGDKAVDGNKADDSNRADNSANIVGRDGGTVANVAKAAEDEKIKKDAAKAAEDEDEKVKTAIANVQKADNRVVNAALSIQTEEIVAIKYAQSCGIRFRNDTYSWIAYLKVDPVRDCVGLWVAEVKNWVNATGVVLADNAKNVLDGTANESEWQIAVGVANSATDEDMNDKWNDLLSAWFGVDARKAAIDDAKTSENGTFFTTIPTKVDNAAAELVKAKDELTKAKNELVKAMNEWLKAKN
jgi:hypothetical protein